MPERITDRNPRSIGSLRRLASALAVATAVPALASGTLSGGGNDTHLDCSQSSCVAWYPAPWFR